MMGAQVLEKAKELGITIRIEGDQLKIIARPSVVAPLVDDLKAHKPEILELLRPKPEPVLTCFSCKGQNLWLSIHGVTICRNCHPPAHESLEVTICNLN